MISSTIVVACRGARRWFDLDAVRQPFQGVNAEKQAGGYQLTANNKHTRSDATTGPQRDVGHIPYGHVAGAPPLDWHHDQPEPGVIVLGEPPDLESDDPIALAVKIVDCMCPRFVCEVCGVPRERMTGDVEYKSTTGGRVVNHWAGERVGENVNTWKVEGGNPGHAYRSAETLGWSDCGHDAYRKGRVFDPYHNPAIEAACAILDRDYITS